MGATGLDQTGELLGLGLERRGEPVERGQQVVRGRIDAVYDEPGSGADDATAYLVVDWKTGARQSADPLQLALYRLAWAELRGVALEKVRAGFFYVRSGELVVHDDLPDRARIEELLG